ncbi:Transcription initiation factor TFIID subunit 9B [Geodia barretti]|uniref:Transcription initiation factor TFIID subunit 9B n=1 Tax=Geodia barretti TaxID=519541 RepID=A0AA35TAW9_GEOBA|nr:Transcription initiation factor TFIID subunit 9B [Geodia barretti]
MAENGAGIGPRDAAVMEAILKEMGVEDFEPSVIHQMLEFTYRYITGVLEDAQIYSGHAGKKELDVSDVRLAVQTRVDHSFTTPPPRDFLINIARQKNSTPLPLIPEKFGPRLPPERYCLTANNYRIKDRKKPPSLSKPQVTLSATFRLPLSKQTTTTATSVGASLKSQLSSPLLQAASAPSPSLAASTLPLLGTTQHGLTGSQILSLQSSSSGLTPSNSMPVLGGGGGGGGGGGNSSTNNSNTTSTPVLSMPLLGKMQ